MHLTTYVEHVETRAIDRALGRSFCHTMRLRIISPVVKEKGDPIVDSGDSLVRIVVRTDLPEPPMIAGQHYNLTLEAVDQCE